MIVPPKLNWIIDWETPEAAIVTDAQFQIGVRGLLFDKLIGPEEPTVAIPDMPYHLSTHIEKYQAFVSSYTIDSFFLSLIHI